MEDQELYEAFFKRSKPYYFDKLVQFREGRVLMFNIYAFFLGIFWMLYRKMYVEAIILALFLMAENFTEEYLLTDESGQGPSALVSTASTAAISFVIGSSSNFFYIRKANRTIKAATGKYVYREQQEAYLKRKGGTSLIFLIFVAAAIILFVISNNFLENHSE